jgi:hypothetical protein
MEEQIKRKAYEKWEAEGRPTGQHDRHWIEAEAEVKQGSGDLPNTWSSDHSGGVAAPSTPEESERQATTSEAIPASSPDNFKPGELASENK